MLTRNLILITFSHTNFLPALSSAVCLEVYKALKKQRSKSINHGWFRGVGVSFYVNSSLGFSCFTFPPSHLCHMLRRHKLWIPSCLRIFLSKTKIPLTAEPKKTLNFSRLEDNIYFYRNVIVYFKKVFCSFSTRIFPFVVQIWYKLFFVFILFMFCF